MAVLRTDIAPGDPGHAAIHNATNAQVNTNTTDLAGKVDSATLTTALQAKVDKSLVNAKGDILVGTADDTLARVGVGANGQVLKADSTAAAGVAWGDGVRGGNGKDYLDVSAAPYSAVLNGTSDDTTILQSAINAASGTNTPVLIPGLAGISAPLQMKSEMTLKSLHFTRWPYPSEAGSYTPKSGLKVLGTFVGDTAIEFQDGVQWANLDTLEINVNSYPSTGTQVAGVTFTGLARSIEMERVGVFNPSAHGFRSRLGGAGGALIARGLSFTTCRSYSAGNATGANADGTQWGFLFPTFTDSSLIDCEAKEGRNGGFSIGNPGDTALIGCRAPFNRGGPGYYITGGDPTMATGNGGITLTDCSSDYSFTNGLLIDAAGRSVVQVDNFKARRDGVDGTSPGVSVAGSSTSNRTCPVLFTNLSTEVEDDDTNNTVFNPVTGLYLKNVTQVSLTSSHIWGKTTSIFQDTGSTGGRLLTATTWYYTGLPTAKTPVTPTIT